MYLYLLDFHVFTAVGVVRYKKDLDAQFRILEKQIPFEPVFEKSAYWYSETSEIAFLQRQLERVFADPMKRQIIPGVNKLSGETELFSQEYNAAIKQMITDYFAVLQIPHETGSLAELAANVLKDMKA